MDKTTIIVLLVGVLLAGATMAIKKGNSDNMEGTKVTYQSIKAAQAKEIMDTEEVIILDVRTPQEYEEGHIEGALLVPDYELISAAETKLPDKDAKILVYCRSGNRSRSAAKELIDMGYTQVYDFGGIMSWTYGIVQ